MESGLLNINHKRAMEWAIRSVPLLDIQTNSSSHFWPSEQWFHELWVSAELPETIALDDVDLYRYPVGRYYELLVRLFFDFHPQWQVVAHQVVLSNDSRTIGEADLVLLHLESGRYFHLEVACKYFLSENNRTDWQFWKGRNPKDTLDGKFAKLQQQAELMQTAEGKEWLLDRGIASVQTMVWLKGYLFVPLASLNRPKLPRWHHQKVAAGWYLALHQLIQWPDQNRQWFLLPKTWWMVMPPLPYDYLAGQLLTMSELHDKLKADFKKGLYRGWLVVQIMEEVGFGKEITRGMIVDSQWPN